MGQFPRRIIVLVFVSLAGCFDPPQPPPEPPPTEPAAAANEQNPRIQPFDPSAGQPIVDPTRPITDPITGPLAALQNAREQIPQLAIQHAINLFHASEGRYPDSFEEFMSRIIDENRIQLPQLAKGLAWQYDVAGHQLLVVQSEPR